MSSFKEAQNNNITAKLDNYAWLRPAWPAPAPESAWAELSVQELSSELNALPPQNISLDTETTGLRYWAPGFGMQSIAVYIPSSGDLFAVSLIDVAQEERASLLRALIRHKIYAFNLTFDGGVLYSVNQSLPKKLRVQPEALLAALAGCSQVFFRHCANEGFNVHSLEMGQRHLFGWEDSQKDWLAASLSSKDLDKANMWRLLEEEDTREGFLYYNAMDARSAWLLWAHFCSEAHRVERPGMIGLHEGEFATLIRDCIRQVFVGIPVDRKKMRQILIDSFRKKAEVHTGLRLDARLTPFIEKWEHDKIVQQWRADISLKTKLLSDGRIVADALDGYDVVDDQGDASSPSDQAEEASKVIVSKEGPAQISADGRLVLPSYRVSLTGGNRFPGFSFNSPDHLRDLLYGHLATAELAYMKKMGEDEVPRFRISYEGKSFIVAGTDKGALPTGADIYPIFGDIGKRIEEAAEADTRYGFAKSYLAASSETKKVHAQLKVHGAGTSRCSGGSGGKGKKSSLSVNPQQLPRSDREFMECFRAPKGFVYLSNDFKGLEKVVQAELSGDPVLTRLYASGEKHDVHLYHTMAIHPDPAVRAAISARYKLDDAVLSQLKKEFKTERAFGKMCLEEGSLVRVRNQGWKRIETITPQDEVWDGTEWRKNDGAIYKGMKSVIDLKGVKMTEDHKMLTSSGVWREAGHVIHGSFELQKPARPSATWTDVWSMVRRIFRSLVKG